jgi:hypothetical protein
LLAQREDVRPIHDPVQVAVHTINCFPEVHFLKGLTDQRIISPLLILGCVKIFL